VELTARDQLVFDLMTKIANDSSGNIKRTLDRLTEVASANPGQFLLEGTNIIRAGMAPFIAELMSVSDPELAMTSIIMQVLIYARLNSKKPPLGSQRLTPLVREVVTAISPLMKKALEQ
jgi:hypothetical protein